MWLARPFSVAEAMLLDSEWELQHPGGNPFKIEFRADGYNHCASSSHTDRPPARARKLTRVRAPPDRSRVQRLPVALSLELGECGEPHARRQY